MNKLRLDFFLSLGLKLVEGDRLLRDYGEFVLDSDTARNMSNYTGAADITITSLAQRKNTGVQPCGDDIQVRVQLGDDSIDTGCCARAKVWNWNDNELVAWKLDLEELIKMQDEHDTRQNLASKKLLEEVCAQSIESSDDAMVAAIYYFKGEAQLIEQQGDDENLILCVAALMESFPDDRIGHFTLGHTGFNPEVVDRVCTVEELNQRIVGMSHYAGAEEFSKYANSDKSPLAPGRVGNLGQWSDDELKEELRVRLDTAEQKKAKERKEKVNAWYDEITKRNAFELSEYLAEEGVKLPE